LAHCTATPISPASLPPIPTVTSASSAPSASNCGGALILPLKKLWDWVMSAVVAPWQLASVNDDGSIARAMSEG
jgi:hypothetical protein